MAMNKKSPSLEGTLFLMKEILSVTEPINNK